MANLIVETAGLNQSPRTVALSGEAIIGREKSNNIFIDDQRASRQHAKITREPDGSYLLVDLGSRNGLTVNGTRISRRKMSDKDRILIGRTSLIFQVSSEEVSAKENQATMSESGKSARDELKKAIQDVSSGPESKKLVTNDNGKKLSAKSSSIGEIIEDAPSFFNRIIIWLSLLIFFGVILFFSREMTKRWLFKAHKASPGIPAAAAADDIHGK